MFWQAEPSVAPECTYTISARGKQPHVPVFAFLRRQFGDIPLNQVGSLFGFVEKCTLYGGRGFSDRELSDRDVMQLNNAGIGIRLPMSNHHATEEEFEEAWPLLAKYHRKGNSVIVTNDELAGWIRAEFPDYRLDASVIKNIDNLRKLDKALALYDEVVLPMSSNEDFDFLGAIDAKDRITLFANAGCALTCPSKICYPSISKLNKFKGGEFQCSQPIKEREMYGMVDFDLNRLMEMGFTSFKLLRARRGGMTGV